MTVDTSVGIDNVPFAIMRLIKDAPYQTMWVRELLKNSIEATQQYITNHKIEKPVPIRVRALKVNDLFYGWDTTNYKLSFLNYGGMTGKELRDATNLFSSVGKTQSDHDNFGVGMKVTLANFTDILMISYKEGIANYVLVGLEGNRLMRFNDIQNCTDWVESQAEYRGYDLDHDWTEVIIMGKTDPKQNTFTHTFGSNKSKQSSNHVIHKAFSRFVDIPENIDIYFANGDKAEDTVHGSGRSAWGKNGIKFQTKEQVWDNAKTKVPECFKISVKGEDDNIYHYYYDAAADSGDPATEGFGSRYGNTHFVSLIWGKHNDKERYDVNYIDKWKRIATRLGIYADHKHFKVDVELPYNQYTTTTYRNELKLIDSESDDAIGYRDFIKGIEENFPDEIVEKIRQHNQKATPEDIQDRIREYLKENYNEFPLPGSSVKGDTVAKPKASNKKPVPKKASGRPRPKVFAPVQIGTPKFVADHNLPSFVEFNDNGASNQDVIYYNPEHKAVDALFARIQDEFVEDVHAAIRTEACELLKVKIGAKIVFAKGQLDSDWFDNDTYRNITTSTALTFDALQSEGLVPYLRKFGKQKQTEFENFGLSNEAA